MTFAKRTGLIAAGQAAVKLTQLVIAVVLVRLLDPVAWNETAFLLSIYLAGTTIGTLNLHHGIVFFLPRIPAEQQARFVRQTVLVLLTIGVAIAVGLALAAPLLSGGRLGDPGRLPPLGLAIALELPSTTFAMLLVALERFAGAALWDLVGTAIVVLGTVVPVLAGAGVTGIVFGLVAAGAIRLVAGLLIAHSVLPRSGRARMPGLLTSQLRYGLPLGLTLAVAMSNRLVDKWLIAIFRPGDFGVYAVAAQEVPLLAVLPYAGGTALIAALVDAFRRGDRADAHRRWVGLTADMSSVVVPLSIALVLLAPEAIVAAFGREFEAGVVPFQIFTLITLHRVAEYGMLLRAADRGGDLVRVALVTLAANAVLAGIGAATAGMIGASLGTLAASAIGWWYALRQIGRALDVPIRSAFAWPVWTRLVIAATLAAALAQAMATLLTDTLGAGAAVKLATYLVVVTPVVVGLRLRPATPLGNRAAPRSVTTPVPPGELGEGLSVSGGVT